MTYNMATGGELMSDKIGEKIRELRMAKGMTLEELGNAVGVGKSTVRKWETGMIANMKRDKIQKLADALGVPVWELMGWPDPDVNYYIESEARDLAQFLKDNPEYRILFDASRKVKREDIEKALKVVNIFIDD